VPRVHLVLAVCVGLSAGSAAATSPCNAASALTAASAAGDADAAARAFALLGADVGQMQADDPCLAPVETALVAYATEAHRYAQKFKKRTDYDAADARYTVLRRLPRTPSRTRHDFFHAELLQDLGRLAEADVLYKAVVDADPRGEYARTSAYNRVLGVDMQLRGRRPPSFVKGVMERQPSGESTPVAGPLRVVLERTMMTVCDDYIAAIGPHVGEGDRPAQEELRVVQLQAAMVRLSPGQTGGEPRLRELSVRWPDSNQGKRAALLLLERLWTTNRRDEFVAELERVSSSVQAGDSVFDEEIKAWWKKLGERP
jgi:hypothetical protein